MKFHYILLTTCTIDDRQAVKHFTLSNGAIGKVVHLHGYFKILQIVQELEEGPKLLKCDSLQRDNNETLSLFLKHKVNEMCER